VIPANSRRPAAFAVAILAHSCPVPPRNPRTGEDWLGFSRLFSELRRATLRRPGLPSRASTIFTALATNTRVPSTEQGKLLRIGDAVVPLEFRYDNDLGFSPDSARTRRT